MERIARFYKISLRQFMADWVDTCGGTQDEARRVYDAISLPRRATVGSAGYDFFTPAAICLAPNETTKIPTGIRVQMQLGWVLQLFPRSGLGFKYRLQMNNTVGVIDSDYFEADNEGHIFVKMTNASNEGKTLRLQAGEGFAQGIFLPFGITEDDDAQERRIGGFGSTTKNS